MKNLILVMTFCIVIVLSITIAVIQYLDNEYWKFDGKLKFNSSVLYTKCRNGTRVYVNEDESKVFKNASKILTLENNWMLDMIDSDNANEWAILYITLKEINDDMCKLDTDEGKKGITLSYEEKYGKEYKKRSKGHSLSMPKRVL